MLNWLFGNKRYDPRYTLSYGERNVWIATLGRTPEQIFDPKTGKEDFSEQRKVGNFLETWRPQKKWVPQPICLHFKARGRKCYKADRIFHGAVGPFISENAVEKMRPWLEKEGHILPLDVVNSDEKFFLWWVPLIRESVDFRNSEKFPNGKTIKKYAFNQRKLNDVNAFRPHHTGAYNPQARGNVFVSNDFRQAWIDAKLTGIKFNLN